MKTHKENNIMKMTAIFEGMPIKNPNYYDTHGDTLILSDGTEINFFGEENDCSNDCYNYADWSALEDTGFFEDKTITAKTLKLEECDYGFKINGYFVPCYSVQNGYYTSFITITAKDQNGNIIDEIGTICK